MLINVFEHIFEDYMHMYMNVHKYIIFDTKY